MELRTKDSLTLSLTSSYLDGLVLTEAVPSSLVAPRPVTWLSAINWLLHRSDQLSVWLFRKPPRSHHQLFVFKGLKSKHFNLKIILRSDLLLSERSRQVYQGCRVGAVCYQINSSSYQQFRNPVVHFWDSGDNDIDREVYHHHTPLVHHKT